MHRSVHVDTPLAGADMVIPRLLLAQAGMTPKPRTTKPASTIRTPVDVVVLVISMVITNPSDGWFSMRRRQYLMLMRAHMVRCNSI